MSKTLKLLCSSAALLIAAQAQASCPDFSGNYTYVATPGPFTADITIVQSGCKNLAISVSTQGFESTEIIKADGLFRSSNATSASSSVFTETALVTTTVNSAPSVGPYPNPTGTPMPYPSTSPSYGMGVGYMTSNVQTITKDASGDLTITTKSLDSQAKLTGTMTETAKKAE